MDYKEIVEILKEEQISDKCIDILKPYMVKGNVFGFAEIQIDNEPIGINEINLELKQIGITNANIICYDSNPAEDVPEDWFEDYLMCFVFTGKCQDYEEVKRKQNEYRPSYILEHYLI